MSAQKVVMVTGGSGLVGKAIQEVIEAENNADEKWIYLSSKVSAVEKPKSLLARPTSSHGSWRIKLHLL